MHTEPHDLHSWPEALVTTLQGASGHLTISEQTSPRCPLLLLISAPCEPLLTRRVSKTETEETTQWVRRFDRNLHNTIEKETQERHQLCWGSSFPSQLGTEPGGPVAPRSSVLLGHQSQRTGAYPDICV